MTREQVHDLMENELRCVQRGNYCDRDCAKCPLVKDDKELIEAYGYVIKALEQEPCEDAISRQSMLDYLKYLHGDMPEEEFVKALPSVTPAPKKGKWIVKDGREQGYDIAGIKTWYIQIMCNRCGFIKTAIEGHTGQYKFCPNCGSFMTKEG